MTAIAPARLAVDRRALTVLERVFTVALPHEGCALLLGPDASCSQIGQVWPCLNSWPEAAERTRRFALDPREQLVAQRWARERGLVVLGSAHSHPLSRPEPSALDLELCFAPALMLIGAPAQQPGGWAFAFWWVDDGMAGLPPEPRRLPWRMVDILH